MTILIFSCIDRQRECWITIIRAAVKFVYQMSFGVNLLVRNKGKCNFHRSSSTIGEYLYLQPMQFQQKTPKFGNGRGVLDKGSCNAWFFYARVFHSSSTGSFSKSILGLTVLHLEYLDRSGKGDEHHVSWPKPVITSSCTCFCPLFLIVSFTNWQVFTAW